MNDSYPLWFISFTIGSDNWFDVFVFIRHRVSRRWSIRKPFAFEKV